MYSEGDILHAIYLFGLFPFKDGKQVNFYIFDLYGGRMRAVAGKCHGDTVFTQKGAAFCAAR